MIKASAFHADSLSFGSAMSGLTSALLSGPLRVDVMTAILQLPELVHFPPEALCFRVCDLSRKTGMPLENS